jgi:hypothetical protein
MKPSNDAPFKIESEMSKPSKELGIFEIKIESQLNKQAYYSEEIQIDLSLFCGYGLL